MESEASLWSREVGGRLRMLQASFAEDSPATREKYLVEEIERSLKGIGESRRNEYLDALVRCFPGPERIGVAPSNPSPTVAEPVKKTVEELAEELLGRVDEFNKEGKEWLLSKLQAAGLIAVPDQVL